MTDEEKQKLNEKLLKWVGFTFNDDWSDTLPYKDPTGNILQDWTPFTDSLDACFKWLVPKGKIEDGMGIDFESPDVNRDFPRPYWVCNLHTFNYGAGFSVRVEGETPALTLCLAIEELIDAENLELVK